MAETFTVTMTNEFADNTDENVITIDWTSHVSDGTCDGDICDVFTTAQKLVGHATIQPSRVKGYIKAIETIPGSEGDLTTATPDNGYDIELQDSYGYDLAGGSLADRSDSAAEKVIPSSPIPVDDEITLAISNAGNSKQGRIKIYVSPGP